MGLLLSIGLALFAGEWLLGSMGWSVLIGTELMVGIAFGATLIALRVTGVSWTLAISFVVAALLAIAFGLRLSNTLWRRLAEALGFTFPPDPSMTPLIVGIVVVGIVLAVIGAILLGAGIGGSGAAAGLSLGLVGGILLGALSAITFDRRAGVGAGVAIGLALWPMLMVVLVARRGIDIEDLKRRFWPQTTIDTAKETVEWVEALKRRFRPETSIDTAKETIEWVRERTPLGPKS
jgi:hypothetical protein